MVRQQNAADGDRPHYYSQYWINVALGKPTGEQAETEEQGLISPTALLETLEAEPELPPPPPPAPRVEPKTIKKPAEKKAEPARLSSLADLADIAELMKNSAAMDDDVVPDIEANNAAAGAATALPPIVTDFDLTENAAEPVAEVEETEGIEPLEDFDEFEFDDEDEEEDEWGGRRPGKGGGPKKPTKPQRPPRRREF